MNKEQIKEEFLKSYNCTSLEQFKKKMLTSDKFYEIIDDYLTKCTDNQKLQDENTTLKQALNYYAFSSPPNETGIELGLRYLREIGYVGFDDERKVYLNKHNNEPLFCDEEREKSYYVKEEELNEYTKQLEYQLEDWKKKFKEKEQEYNDLLRYKAINEEQKEDWSNLLDSFRNQQKEFIEWLEKVSYQDVEPSDFVNGCKAAYGYALRKYKEIIGSDK